jgi:hypothetical protein
MQALPIRQLFVWMTFLQLLLPSAVRADVLLQVVIYSNDEGVLNHVSDGTSAALLNTLLEAEPDTFQSLRPGEDLPPANRLRGLRLSAPPSSLVEGRALQIHTCPPQCAHSGSTYCRSLGCAFCGQSCSRRLRELLAEGGAAAAVEETMNEALAPYCASDPKCEIGAKILVVNADGTTRELV